jgi:hypothetical protein
MTRYEKIPLFCCLIKGVKMKLKIALAVLFLAFAVGTAHAEDRLTAGYTQKAVATLSDTWGVGVEKDFGELGAATVVGDLGFTNVLNGAFADTLWTAGLGVEVPLSELLNLEVGASRSFVNGGQDFTQYRAGVVYQGDAWRFAGAAVKADGVDVFAEASAERKVFGDLAVGVASSFDQSEYFATTVFASYSF